LSPILRRQRSIDFSYLLFHRPPSKFVGENLR
jgi:hypothetical protein